ncbi:ATP-binding protein [Burkholderiaceae bacterium UC74_6]
MQIPIWLPLVAVAVIGLLCFVGVQRALQESLASQLSATLRANREALDLWLDYEWERTSKAASMLAKVDRLDNLDAMRSSLRQSAERLNAQGLSLVDLNGHLLVRSFDGAPPETHLDWERLGRGEPCFAGVARGPGGMALVSLAVPFYWNDKLQGALVLHRSAAAHLTRVLTVGRYGQSGESYAFDREGHFLTESRFPDHLRQIGLMSLTEDSVILRLKVADPGVNLVASERPDKAQADWPLTAMVARAVSRGPQEQGVDVIGYRDYRGVPVVGAWQWIDAYGIGLAAEIDVAEAFQLKHALFAAFVVLCSLLALTSAALGWLQRRQRLQGEALEAESERRRVSEQRFRRLAGGMPYPSLLVGPDLRIELCNDQAARLLQRRVADLQDCALSDFMSADDVANVVGLGRSALGKDLVSAARCEADLITPSQGRLPVEVGIAAFDDSLLLTLVDLMERREVAQAQQQARQQAEQASQAKSHFLANMSHEIRTPMNAVLGYAQLLQLDGGLGPEERRKVDAILRAGQHLLGLINSVLDMAKIEAGQIQLRAEEQDLNEVVAGLDEIFALRCEQQNQVWRCLNALPRPCMVRGDRLRLNQVLINLIGNAQKFARREVTLEIEPPDAAHAGFRFVVRDDGPGLGAGEAARVFEVFQQGEAGVSKGGTGLGLAITRGLVEAMGGSIELLSPGVGCEAVVHLPLELTEPLGGRSGSGATHVARHQVRAADAPIDIPERLRAELLNAAELGELTRARRLLDDWATQGADAATLTRLQARVQAYDWDGLIHDLQTVTP